MIESVAERVIGTVYHFTRIAEGKDIDGKSSEYLEKRYRRVGEIKKDEESSR